MLFCSANPKLIIDSRIYAHAEGYTHTLTHRHERTQEIRIHRNHAD